MRIAQVSGQSCGQAPWTVLGVLFDTEASAEGVTAEFMRALLHTAAGLAAPPLSKPHPREENAAELGFADASP